MFKRRYDLSAGKRPIGGFETAISGMKRDESAFFIDIHAHDVIKYRRMNLRAFALLKRGAVYRCLN